LLQKCNILLCGFNNSLFTRLSSGAFEFSRISGVPALLSVFTRRRSETADYFLFFVEFSSRQKTENYDIITLSMADVWILNIYHIAWGTCDCAFCRRGVAYPLVSRREWQTAVFRPILFSYAFSLPPCRAAALYRAASGAVRKTV
jgi:hypothetical protein